MKNEEQRFGCGVWILGDVLFFQKWLVTMDV